MSRFVQESDRDYRHSRRSYCALRKFVLKKRKSRSPRWILGIDQTGATRNGSYRSLPFCFIRNHRGGWSHAWHPSWSRGLASLSLPEILKLLEHSEVSKKTDGWIVVDSVLGLPRWLQIPQSMITQEFAKAHSFNGHGKASAEKFFRRYQAPLDAKSFRLCDRLAKAQSVFQTTPAQRNIQTGTFRIWQDLGADSSWYSLWPSSPQASKTLLIEGFPTLMWKQVFGFASRKPALIQEVSDRRGIKLPKLYSTSPDWADSAILALGALELLKSGTGIDHRLPSQAQVEGWILGLPSST